MTLPNLSFSLCQIAPSLHWSGLTDNYQLYHLFLHKKKSPSVHLGSMSIKFRLKGKGRNPSTDLYDTASLCLYLVFSLRSYLWLILCLLLYFCLLTHEGQYLLSIIPANRRQLPLNFFDVNHSAIEDSGLAGHCQKTIEG